jgi:S1-C subfamily serine protease
MNKQQLNPFCFILALVVLIFAVATTVNGQEKPTKVDDGVTLRAGEGFSDIVPSWFLLLKVEAGHFTDRGSAAFISDRMVLTCWHNLRDASKGKLVLVDGIGNRYENIRVVQKSPKLDLALLRVEDERVPYHRVLIISNSDYTPRGTVHAVGLNPATESIEHHTGKLNGQRFTRNGLRETTEYGHTALVVQGMSGGPLINDDGEVVGVNIGRDREGVSHSVTLQRIQWFLDNYEGPTDED